MVDDTPLGVGQCSYERAISEVGMTHSDAIRVTGKLGRTGENIYPPVQLFALNEAGAMVPVVFPMRTSGMRDPLITPEYIVPEIDNVGPWVVGIDVGHHQRHEGDMFGVVNKFTSVGAGTARYIHLKAGAGAYPHIEAYASATGGILLEIFHSPTTTDDGTALTQQHPNRNKLTTPYTLCYHTPTVTADGSLWYGVYSGGGTQRVGGASRAEDERIGAPSEAYLVKVTNTGNGAIDMIVGVDWYEEGAYARE